MRRCIQNKMILKNTSRVVLLVCLLSLSPALAQTGGVYELNWNTIDGGGVSSGGRYSLSAIIGEAEAGAMSGGNYELIGGFLPGGPVCIVDFYHFSLLAEHWLEAPCNAGNDWCGGADLDQLGDVDFNDVDLFVEEWLYLCPHDWPLK